MFDSLISVIVPFYCTENYISKCLDSILNQSYKNLEIIIVDDGSPPSSSEILNKYASIDNRIKIIHQDNMGVSIARNTGINISTGQYIAFVDSDDIIANDMFEYLYNLLQVYNVDISACLEARILSYEDISKLHIKKNIKIIRNKVPFIAGRVRFSSCLYRKEAISNIKFIEGVKIGEDCIFLLDCVLKITNKCVLGCIQKYYYIQRKSSVSNYSKNIYKQDAEFQVDYYKKLAYNYPEFSKLLVPRMIFAASGAIAAFVNGNYLEYYNIYNKYIKLIKHNLISFLFYRYGIKWKIRIIFQMNFKLNYKFNIILNKFYCKHKNFID